MALKIRLRQQGRTNQLAYRLVLADSRSPRDGKHIEILGWYQPNQKEEDKLLKIDAEKVDFWLSKGAQLTEKAEALIKRAAPSVIRNYREKQEQRRLERLRKKKQKNRS